MQREFRIPKSTFRIRLFYMALGAGGRACGIAGLLLVLMAFDTLLVHHLLWFQLAGRFHFFKAVGFLRKGGMAGVAVLQPVLVGVVGKRYIPPGPAVDFNLFSTLVGSSGDCDDRNESENDAEKYQTDFDFFSF